MSLEQDVCSWYEQGRTQRTSFDNRWQRFLDYTGLPRKDITTQRQPGATKTDLVFSSVCSEALSTFCNFLHGTLFPQAAKFHSLKFVDEAILPTGESLNFIPESAEWLWDCVVKMHRMYSRTNFYSSTLEWITDLGWAGNSEMLTEFVRKSRTNKTLAPISYSCIPVGSFVWGEGDDGQIDKSLYLMEMAAQNIINRWKDAPGAVIPDIVTRTALREPMKNLKILHGIIPRDFMPNRRLKTDKEMPYSSMWILWEDKKTMIYESGYPEYPCAAGRWAPIAGEIYARGQGDIALPDTATLNQAEDMGLLSWEKKLDPPMFTENGSVVGRIDFNAGANNIVRDINRRPVPLAAEGTDLNWHVINLERKEKSIQQVFFYQPIKALISNESPQPEKTAFEVSARLKLLHQIIAPVSGRITDGVKKMINTTFSIMLRNGMFAPLPPILTEYIAATKRDLSLEIEYQGPLARSQREEEATAVLETAQDLLFLSQFDKNVLYQLDAVKAAQYAFAIRGTEHLRREQRQVDVIVEKDQQIEALTQQLQVANSVADTAGKLTPALQAMNGNQQTA